MKILVIVGARPQFIKAAMVSRAIVTHNRTKKKPPIIEEIIHTGQHYDESMSDIFLIKWEFRSRRLISMSAPVRTGK